MQIIRATGIDSHDAVLDAGGGASTLVDYLLDDGFADVSVLDVSSNALVRSRERLDERADKVTWIEADILEFQPRRLYDLWHDRAVFHFLTEAHDCDRYVDVVRNSLRADGNLVLATFGPDGPMRCSGLDIQRYGIDELQQCFGQVFELRSYELNNHVTPSGTAQQFLYTWWQLRRRKEAR